MRIGLLPLYVKLYDDKLPEMRKRLENFYEEIAQQFEQRGAEVIRSPFCRLENEFAQSVRHFEERQADAVVTLHMAYSPSLESVEVLSGTRLPIVVLDTTQTLEFTNLQDPEEISYCHGIHGVMDMCSMLLRRGKTYAIAAGHYLESDCIDCVCGYVRAAISAKALEKSKVGLVGGAFAGMGDFQVSYEEMKQRFGIEVVQQEAEQLRHLSDGVTQEELQAEKEENSRLYELDQSIRPEEYEASVRSCLALRKCVQEQKLTAFSINFEQMGRDMTGLDTMPFLECCKAMSRGIGYAGEGDALTAAFVGALLSGYPETTFVEIFCPDWKNNMLFLSHMGEMNYRIAATKPRICRAGVNYSPGGFPYAGYARMKGGKGVYVNVSRAKEDYRLTLSPAQMMDFEHDSFGQSMRGWMKPSVGCGKFLEELSRNGATHHSAFVYGADVEELVYFGQLLNLDTVVI